MTSPVDMVHRQLECLKYVGGMRYLPDGKGIPTGQGLDVSIVVLPDLLLDVRPYNFGAFAPVFAVGGRAARMACALLHLMGEDDGTLQIYLLTKTGNLGRLLLENEFGTGPSHQMFSHPFLEHILLHDGQPRCAIREAPGETVRSSPLNPAREIRKTDLEEPSVRQIIQKARAICLASLKTPHLELLDVLLTQASDQSLFVDTRMSKDPRRAIGGLMRHLRTVQRDHRAALNKIAAVFLRYDQEDAFIKAAGGQPLDAVCKDLQISIVTYGKNYARLWVPNRTGPAISIACPADVKQEGVSEYFKAGVLLSWSVYQAVRSMTRSHPKLYGGLVHEWASNKGQEDGWETVLLYAVDLAMTRSKRDGSCALEDVVDYLREEEKNEVCNAHLPGSSAHFDPTQLLLQTEPQGQPRQRLVLDNDAAPGVLAQLAGRRRVSMPRKNDRKGNINSLACRGLALCDPLRCVDGIACPKENRRTPVAAVMIDLDGTLMDSDEQRARALATALNRLEDGLDPSARVDFFTNNVYKRNDLLHAFKAIPNFPDLRQQWNHSAWYITYLLFARDADFQKETDLWSPQRVAAAKTDGASEEERRKLDGWLDHYRRMYRHIEEEEKESIIAAMAAFEHVRLYPFKEARDFLESLRLTGSFELYVVSEGHPDTQWMKLRGTGLARFFDREHLLTTHDGGQPRKALDALQEGRQRLAEEAANVRSHSERLTKAMGEQSRMSNELLLAVGRRIGGDPKALEEVSQVITEAEANGRKRLRNEILILDTKAQQVNRRFRVVDFVNRVIKRMEKKGDLYASAIRAILRNSTSPRTQLQDFERLIEPVSPNKKLKFAMIGDRHTKDIQPPGSLLGDRIVTIRMLALKYAVDAKEIEADQKAAPPPRFMVDTLAQAKAILLRKETWSSVRCASDPPIFNCRVETATSLSSYYPEPDDKDVSRIGLDYIECGCEMLGHDFRLVRRICAGILVEHLSRCNEAEREALLARYLEKTAPHRLPVGDRALVLCSLVRAGMLSQDLLDRFQVPLVREIAADAEEIRAKVHPLRGTELSGEYADLEQAIHTTLQCVVDEGIPDARREAKKALEHLGWGSP